MVKDSVQARTTRSAEQTRAKSRKGAAAAVADINWMEPGLVLDLNACAEGAADDWSDVLAYLIAACTALGPRWVPHNN